MMSVLTGPTIAMQMEHNQILQVHSHVLVIVAMPGMDLPVLTRQTTVMLMHLAPTLMVDSLALVQLVTLETVQHVPMLMNVQLKLIIVISMLHA